MAKIEIKFDRINAIYKPGVYTFSNKHINHSLFILGDGGWISDCIVSKKEIKN